MDVSSFPLLHLPNNARMHVLRTMNRFESINLSFCSKATKALVKSLYLKAQYVTVFLFDENLAIEIRFEEFSRIQTHFCYKSYRNPYDIRNFIPDTIKSYYEGTEEKRNIEFNKEKDGFEIFYYMEHYLEVLHHSAIGLNCYASNFDIDSISETFKGFDLRRIKVWHADLYTQRLLKDFPHPKELYLNRNPFEGSELSRKILIQNFDYICLGNFFPVELNDLLLVNSSVVNIFNSKLLVKDLNVFIKHWIGGSNNRLQYLYVWPNSELRNQIRDLNENTLFNGVKYRAAPAEQRRIFNKPDSESDFGAARQITGGFDFQRKDGTKATIKLSRDDPIVEMFVWP